MMSEKKFDAVKTMREIGDKLSKEFMNLSYEEQKRYIIRGFIPKLSDLR